MKEVGGEEPPDEEWNIKEWEVGAIVKAFLLAQEDFTAYLDDVLELSGLPSERFNLVSKAVLKPLEDGRVTINDAKFAAKSLSSDSYALKAEVSRKGSEEVVELYCYNLLGSFILPFNSGLVAVKDGVAVDDPFDCEVYGYIKCIMCDETFTILHHPEAACHHVKLLLETALTFAVSDVYRDLRLTTPIEALAVKLAPHLFNHVKVEVEGVKVDAYRTRYGYAVLCPACESEGCTHTFKAREVLREKHGEPRGALPHWMQQVLKRGGVAAVSGRRRKPTGGWR